MARTCKTLVSIVMMILLLFSNNRHAQRAFVSAFSSNQYSFSENTKDKKSASSLPVKRAVSKGKIKVRYKGGDPLFLGNVLYFAVRPQTYTSVTYRHISSVHCSSPCRSALRPRGPPARIAWSLRSVFPLLMAAMRPPRAISGIHRALHQTG